jgi:hypothetical protein
LNTGLPFDRPALYQNAFYIYQKIIMIKTFEKKIEVLQVKIEIVIQKDTVKYETTDTFY